jgi:hypothetical protein
LWRGGQSRASARSLAAVHRLSNLQLSQYLTSKYRLPELAAKEKNENNFSLSKNRQNNGFFCEKLYISTILMIFV